MGSGGTDRITVADRNTGGDTCSDRNTLADSQPNRVREPESDDHADTVFNTGRESDSQVLPAWRAARDQSMHLQSASISSG
jgi:hypothetical protein